MSSLTQSNLVVNILGDIALLYYDPSSIAFAYLPTSNVPRALTLLSCPSKLHSSRKSRQFSEPFLLKPIPTSQTLQGQTMSTHAQDPATSYLVSQNDKAAEQSNASEDAYILKSSAVTPKLDTSNWPLLLKNYDKLLIRSAHYTPIPAGASPLKRDLASYIKSVLALSVRRVGVGANLNGS